MHAAAAVLENPSQIEEAKSGCTPSEGEAAFERASQRYLKMSTQEFLERWESGYFKGHQDLEAKAANVALLLPLLSAR